MSRYKDPEVQKRREQILDFIKNHPENCTGGKIRDYLYKKTKKWQYGEISGDLMTLEKEGKIIRIPSHFKIKNSH